MDEQLKVRFKIGEIEFEAEGSPSDVERERESFKSTLLPLAIDAMVRTRGAVSEAQYIETGELPTLLPEQSDKLVADSTTPHSDLSRTSLASFIKSYGSLNDQDFALIAAYYDEKKNNATMFSSENIKQFYSEARRTEYSNISMLLRELARKGYIMDTPNTESKIPKQYTITTDGILYVESYIPKEGYVEKKSKAKARKPKAKNESVYASLNADDLNLKNYPVIKAQDPFKQQMILIMYIVFKEGHGEAFSTADIQCLMTEKLGLPATKDQINGVFKRNRKWFTDIADETNAKAVKHKILTGAKEFAQSIIDGNG